MKMTLAVAIYLAVWFTPGPRQQPANQQNAIPKSSEAACPMHDAHKHGAAGPTALNQRGEKGMGFSQTATTHHFLIKPDGGVIEVEANDPADAANRAGIRKHLAHIAAAFSKQDFDIPMFVHDTMPPGVPEMKQLSKRIKYSFEQTSAGGRVVIVAHDQESLDAIHKFLRFQIQEHDTGDPMDVPKHPLHC